MEDPSKDNVFSFPDGDVILVSSDGLEFQLPQADSQSALQSVTMTENARTLDGLLKIVYSIEAGPALTLATDCFHQHLNVATGPSVHVVLVYVRCCASFTHVYYFLARNVNLIALLCSCGRAPH
ncbi:uncharacterized protein EI90DRAFT_3038247 [Cantharellus anzutake]|uniref:uncharacterized protein n=1 Tax=Cantharellus anzutake TaxID=1750568 RepID=UPI0019053D4D|nr:uncharacterized protein EI90DRAFT_3038247 [Cantharellus anzutake]KAF8339896.1 hypothetical protein EI90DRAFT_3038247 [Cantharellus anzutake]